MDTDTYLVFVVLGFALVVMIGQLLIRSGQVYLEEVFPDPRVANSVSRLLAVLFYLFALGVLGVISTMDVPVEGEAQTVVTKLGVVLLVLGIVFAGTMAVLSRIRSRRQEEEQEEVLMASMQANALQQHEDLAAEPKPATAPAETDARLVQPVQPTPPATGVTRAGDAGAV